MPHDWQLVVLGSQTDVVIEKIDEILISEVEVEVESESVTTSSEEESELNSEHKIMFIILIVVLSICSILMMISLCFRCKG